LRLDQRDHLAMGLEVLNAGRQDKDEGDEGEVGRDQVNRFWQQILRGVTQIDPFHGDNPRVASELFVELGLADVDRVDAGSPVLQEAVRESAGGRPGIHADFARNIDAEVLDGREQLVPAPADEALPLLELEQAAFGEHLTRLLHPSPAPLAGEKHLAGHDQSLGLLPALGQPELEQQLVRTELGHTIVLTSCSARAV
jgi:hypothetical protein